MARDAYGNIARFYDTLIEPLNAPLRALGKRMYSPAAGSTVLDIGCGTGTHLAVYADTGAALHGIDLSPAMLERAGNRLGDGAVLHLGDARTLPFADDSIDLVLAASMLHELDRPTAEAIVAEVGRTLAPNGRFLVIDFYPQGLSLKGRAIRTATHLIERIAGRAHYRNFRSFLRRGGAHDLVGMHGFAGESERVVSGGNMHITVFQRSEKV